MGSYSSESALEVSSDSSSEDDLFNEEDDITQDLSVLRFCSLLIPQSLSSSKMPGVKHVGPVYVVPR